MNRDKFLVAMLRSCVGISAGIVFLVMWFVCLESFAAFSGIGPHRFVLDDSWHPTEDQYWLIPMLVVSLLVVAGSLLITAPLGLGSAIFLHCYAPRKVGWCFRRMLEVLAGIPSVVYGLWGITVVIPAIQQISSTGQGQGMLAGILVLSIMTLPIVAVAADAALIAVDPSQIRAAAALGFGKRAIMWQVMIPSARRGLFAGIILQVARAIGETMVVLMVCGNVPVLPESIFSSVRTLTVNIAMEMGDADGLHRSSLYVSALLLLVVVALLMMLHGFLFQDREARRS